MGTFTVTTPVQGHNGAVGSVTFVDGTATVDEDTHAAELAYFRGAGYSVEPADGQAADEGGDTDVDALRAEAAELGLKVHHNAKPETIQRQIDEARAAQSADGQAADEGGDTEENDR